MSAPLEMFLRAITSGNTTFSPEMYAHFGGDSILEQLRKYDPNAKWTDTELGGGEGGSTGTGKRLDFDVTKLPNSSKGTAGYDLNPANLHSRMRPGAKSAADDVYGDVANSAEFLKEKDPLWTKLAPLVVGGLAPMAGAALAAGGIGGAAGLTAGVTGSGLTGANAMGLPSWLTQQLTKLPQTAGQLAEGKWNPLSLGPAAFNAMGLDPNWFNAARGAMSLAQLSKR